MRLTQQGTSEVHAGPGLLRLVSHELRQPLAAALGSSLALSEPSRISRLDDGDRAILLDIIRRNLHQLDRQLDSLHVYGELEAGDLKIYPVVVPLLELLNACRDAFDPLRATIEVVVLCEPDIFVEADTTLMHQVLSNLLVNAKKFSPPGSRVVVHGRQEGDAVIISVRDEGMGIPIEDQERIFEPGISGDHTRGLGLGLYICNAIVTAHGGRIWVDEPKNRGARFNIALKRPAPLSAEPVA
jgi:two-component system, OmpR family, sensor histidine kinase KdpD